MSYASKSSKTKPLVVGIAVLVVAAVAAKYYWPSAAQEVKTPVQTVTTVKVVQRDFPLILDTTGTTVAANVVDIRPQVTNVVTKVHIKEGQMVHAGDVLLMVSVPSLGLAVMVLLCAGFVLGLLIVIVGAVLSRIAETVVTALSLPAASLAWTCR